MRARYPDSEGYVERDGVRLFYEAYGDGEPTIVFLPASWFTHSRCWKAQVAYLARHFRVVTFDGRGNGRADRPRDPSAYQLEEHARDALAVMDATDTEAAVLVSISASTPHALALASQSPERVSGCCLIGPFYPGPEVPGWMSTRFNGRLDSPQGFDLYNRHTFREDWRRFAETWSAIAFPEPHSTKQIEDVVAWALETDGGPITASLDGIGIAEHESIAEAFAGGLTDAFRAAAEAIDCPALVACGDRDAVTPLSWARTLADDIPGGRLEVVAGAGHCPHARYPVRFNLVLREFIEKDVLRIAARESVAA